MFPATKDWEFASLDDYDRNDDIFKKFHWTDVNGDHPDIHDASVIVACQPPWLMSDELMWQFTQLKSVCDLNTGTWVQNIFGSFLKVTRVRYVERSAFGAR